MMRTFSALLLLVAACGGSDSTGSTPSQSSDPNAPAAADKSSGPSATSPSSDDAPKCGKAACATSEYCELSYDSKADAWTPSRCVAYPSGCAAPKSAESTSDVCECIDKASHVCPSSGTNLSSCQSANEYLAFGCTSL